MPPSSNRRSTPASRDATKELHAVATPPPTASLRTTTPAYTGWHNSSTDASLALSPPPVFHKQLDMTDAPQRLSNAKRAMHLPPLRRSAPTTTAETNVSATGNSGSQATTDEVLFLTHGLFSAPRERVLLYKEIPDSVADLRNALLKQQLSNLLETVSAGGKPQTDTASLLSRPPNTSPFFGEPLTAVAQSTGSTQANLGRRSFVEIPKLQAHTESHVHLLFHERIDYEDDLLYATFDDKDKEMGEEEAADAMAAAAAADGPSMTVSYREMLATGGRSEKPPIASTVPTPEKMRVNASAPSTSSCFWSSAASAGKQSFALPTTFMRFNRSNDSDNVVAATEDAAPTAQLLRQKIIDDIVETQRRKAIESALSVGVDQLNAPPKQLFLRCDFFSDHSLRRHQFKHFCLMLVEACVTKPLIESVSRLLASEPLPLLTDETPFYSTSAAKGKTVQPNGSTRRRRSTKLDPLGVPGGGGAVGVTSASTLHLSVFDRSYLEQVKKLVTVSVCDDDQELLSLPRTLFLCVAAPSNTHISLVERVANNIQHTVNTNQHPLLQTCRIVMSPYESTVEFLTTQIESPREKDADEDEDLPPEEEGWPIEIMPPQRGKWELWALSAIQNSKSRTVSMDEGYLSMSSDPFSAFSSRRASKDAPRIGGDGGHDEGAVRGLSLLISEPSTTHNPAHHQQQQLGSRAGSASSSRPLVDILDVSIANTDGGNGANSSRRDEADGGVDFFQVARRKRKDKGAVEDSVPVDGHAGSNNEVAAPTTTATAQGTPLAVPNANDRSFSVVYGSEGSPVSVASPLSRSTTTGQSFRSPSNSTTDFASPAGSPLLSGSRRHSKVFGAAVKNQRLRRLASISGGGDAVASIMSQVDCGVPVAPLIAQVKSSGSPKSSALEAQRPDSASSTDSLDNILLANSPGDSTSTNPTSAALDLFGVQSEFQTKLRWVSAHQTVLPDSIITGRKAKGKGKAKVSLEEILKQRLDMLMTRYGLEQRPNPGALSEQNVTTVRRCAGCIFDRPHAFCTQCGYLFCTDCFYFIHRPRNETFMWYASQHPGRIKAMVTQEFLQNNDFQHAAISVDSLFRSAAIGDVTGSPATATTSPVDVPVMATAVSDDANSVASRNARKVLEAFRATCSATPDAELATLSGGGLSDEAFRLSIHNVLAQLEERLRISCAEATPSTEFKDKVAKASPAGKGAKKKKSPRVDPTQEQKRLVTGALDAFNPTQISHLLEVVGRFQLRVPPALYRLVMGSDEHDSASGGRRASETNGKGGRRVSTISRLVLDGKNERRASIERGPHLLKEDQNARRKDGDDSATSISSLRVEGNVSEDDEALAGLGEPLRSPLGSSISRFELDSDDDDEEGDEAIPDATAGTTGQPSPSRKRGAKQVQLSVNDDASPSSPTKVPEQQRHKSVIDLKLERMMANQPEEQPVALFYEESEDKPVSKTPPPARPLVVATPRAFLVPEPEPVGPTKEELQEQLLQEMVTAAPEKVNWYRSKLENSRKALAGNAIVISVDTFEDPTITRLPAAALEAGTIVDVMRSLGYSVDWMKPSAEVPFLRPTAARVVSHIQTLQQLLVANDEVASRKLIVIVLSRGIIARSSCFSGMKKAPKTAPDHPLAYELVALTLDSVFSTTDGSLGAEQCITPRLIDGLRDAFDRPPLLVMDCWPLRNAAHSLDEEGLGFGLLAGRSTMLRRKKHVEVVPLDSAIAKAEDNESSAAPPPPTATSPTASVNLSGPTSPTNSGSGLEQQLSGAITGDGDIPPPPALTAKPVEAPEETMCVAPVRLAFSYLPQQGGLMSYYLLRALEGRSLFSRVVMSQTESSTPAKAVAKFRTLGWSVKNRPPLKIEDYEVSVVDLHAFISRRVESKGARFLFGDELTTSEPSDGRSVEPSSPTTTAAPDASPTKKKGATAATKPFVSATTSSSPQRSTSPTKGAKRAVSPPNLMRRPSKLASVTIHRLVTIREKMRKDPFIAMSDDSVLPALSFPPATVTEVMRLSMTSSGNPFADQKNVETMFHLQEARRFHVTMWTRCDVPQQLGGAPLHRTRSALEEAAVAAGGVGAAAATAPTLEEDTIYNIRWRRNLINMFQLAINGNRGVTRNGRMIQVVGTRCECSIILDFGSGWIDEPAAWKRIQTFLDRGIQDAERISGKQGTFTIVPTLREGIVQILCAHVDFRAVLLQTLASHERRAATKGLGFPRPTVWASVVVSILGTRRDFRRVRKMIALQTTGSHLLLLRDVKSDPVAENFHAVAARVQALFRARKVRTFLRNVEELIEREVRVREMHESQFAAAMDEIATLLRDAQEQELTLNEATSRDIITTTEVEWFVELVEGLKHALSEEDSIGRKYICDAEIQEWLKLFEAPNRWVLQAAEEKRWAFMLHSHKLQFRQVWQRYYLIIEEHQERVRLRTDARAYVVKLPKLLQIPGFFSMPPPPCDFDVASSLVMFPPNFKALYQKAKRSQEEPAQGF